MSDRLSQGRNGTVRNIHQYVRSRTAIISLSCIALLSFNSILGGGLIYSSIGEAVQSLQNDNVIEIPTLRKVEEISEKETSTNEEKPKEDTSKKEKGKIEERRKKEEDKKEDEKDEKPKEDTSKKEKGKIEERSKKEEDKKEDKKDEKPLNILLLYADDWRHDTLGAAGNKIVKTPVLDKLASEGIRFTQNCVTTSICWVSRATLFSGLYMARHNTKLPQEWFLDWKDCLYDLLKKAGYAVAHSGKMGIWTDYTAEKLDFHVDEDGWHVREIGGREWHITEKNEADSLRFLRNRDKSKPFFLNTAFFATHAVDGDTRQYLPQERSLSMYVNDTVPTPVTGTEEAWEAMPEFFGENNEGRTRWRWRFDTPEKFQHMMKNYYRMASEVDTASGAIIEEIRKQGELDNTLIIFTTDNGNFHAEHGLADKWYPHQESIRVPLIIKDPRASPEKRGTLNEEFTLNIDLAPTILSAAGVKIPKQMMGRDMSQLYLNHQNNNKNDDSTKKSVEKVNTTQATTTTTTTTTTEWRKEFFYEHPQLFSKDYIPASEALVRKDYKYFYWPAFDVEQFFHIATDPYEENDIIETEEPHQVKILEEMRDRFDELKAIVNSDVEVTL